MGFLRHFKVLVVDEADEFLKQHGGNTSLRRQRQRSHCALYEQLMQTVNAIQRHTTDGSVQTLLFSATFPHDIKRLATEIAPRAIILKVGTPRVQLENIKIVRILCDEDEKFDLLLRIISVSNVGQMIVFCNSTLGAMHLASDLEAEEVGIACSALTGKHMEHSLRDRTMNEFRRGQTQCLVASNVIARGIDVPAVGLVVNFDVVDEMEPGQDGATFMHRVGRTGRFGAKGVCINLVQRDDESAILRLAEIQRECALEIEDVAQDGKAIKESIAQWLAE